MEEEHVPASHSSDSQQFIIQSTIITQMQHHNVGQRTVNNVNSIAADSGTHVECTHTWQLNGVSCGYAGNSRQCHPWCRKMPTLTSCSDGTEHDNGG